MKTLCKYLFIVLLATAAVFSGAQEYTPKKGQFGQARFASKPQGNPQTDSGAGDFIAAGNGEYKSGNYSNAIKFWNKAITLTPELKTAVNPHIAMAYSKLGAQYYLDGNYGESIKYFDYALKLHPKADMLIRRASKVAGKAPKDTLPEAQKKVKIGWALAIVATILLFIVLFPFLIKLFKSIYDAVSPPVVCAGEKAVMPPGYAPQPAMIKVPNAALERLFADPESVRFDDHVRELMDAGYYEKALAVFAAKQPAQVSKADKINLFEIHLRLGNDESASMVWESIKGSKELTENAARCETLAGLCLKMGLTDIAGELSRTKESGGSTGPAQGGDLLAKGLDQSPLFKQAVLLAEGGKYNEALAELLKKPGNQVTLNDRNLLFEIYVRRRDFTRAELMLHQISQEITAKHPVKRLQGRLIYKQNPALSDLQRVAAWGFCAAMARVCREKGRGDFASQLCRMAVDLILTALPVNERPQESYELAVSFEADGENQSALELFQVLAESRRPFRDVVERYNRLKAHAADEPARPAGAAQHQQYAPAPGPVGALKTGVSISGIVLGGRYELRGDLGAGGMGVVYEGLDRQTDKPVAVKRMHSALKEYPKEYERFLSEAKILERLKHPNIVSVHGLVEQGGETYLVLDFVEGRTLSAILKEKKRLPLNECKDIFKGVCEAVHYAHSNNIIHRDLKPSNIMLTGNNVVKVLDFGLASELHGNMSRLTHETTSGTAAYMAPEQHDGVVKREADIYAMGVCLYQMLTGNLPFDGFDYEQLKKAGTYRAVSAILPWLPGGMDGVIDHALAPEPSQRYADALDFWSALKNL